MAFLLLVPTTAPGAAGEPKEQKGNDSATILDPGVLEPEGAAEFVQHKFPLYGEETDSNPDRQPQRLCSELEEIWQQDWQGEAVTWATAGSLKPGESQCEVPVS